MENALIGFLTPQPPEWAEPQCVYLLRRYFGISAAESQEMPLWEREMLFEQLAVHEFGAEEVPDDPFSSPPPAVE